MADRVRPFWALSRMERSLWELANPSLAALLALGRVPGPGVVILGLGTALAGYTAVYALNDLVGYPEDREKVRRGGFIDSAIAVEGTSIRHPLAQGALGFKGGLWWTLTWAFLALAGAYALSPVSAVLFLAGAALEALYCLLARVTPYRTLIHGLVKTAGPLAAVFAVTSTPDPAFVLALFFWFFFWEIGGQNIPADWNDVREDRMIGARTMILVHGPRVAGRIVLGALVLCVICSLWLFQAAPGRPGWFFTAMLLGAGLAQLLTPALVLVKTPDRPQAGTLFTLATYYPPLALGIVVLGLLTQGT
jgi:4-hydroxybenzoate polyprenyltransferase